MRVLSRQKNISYVLMLLWTVSPCLSMVKICITKCVNLKKKVYFTSYVREIAIPSYIRLDIRPVTGNRISGLLSETGYPACYRRLDIRPVIGDWISGLLPET